jgi:hypothetical protein
MIRDDISIWDHLAESERERERVERKAVESQALVVASIITAALSPRHFQSTISTVSMSARKWKKRDPATQCLARRANAPVLT